MGESGHTEWGVGGYNSLQTIKKKGKNQEKSKKK